MTQLLGKYKFSLEGHTSRITCIEMIKDRLHIASGSRDTTIRIWNAKTGKCINILKGHSRSISCLAAMSDNIRLISSALEENIKIWNIFTNNCIYTFEKHNYFIDNILVKNDLILSKDESGQILLWDGSTYEVLQRIEEEESIFPMRDCIKLTSKNHLIIMANSGKSIKEFTKKSKKNLSFFNFNIFSQVQKLV